MTQLLRKAVSQNKRRFQHDGFDLDLTYITPNIIAMAYPASSVDKLFRNRVEDVQRFFNSRHSGHYKVYNLCDELEYSPNLFERYGRFPFDDHNPPPLELILQFCEDVHAFLTADASNVVAVHCRAGKSRTGIMIASYLYYTGAMSTAAEALFSYGEARTTNHKGVTIPSQRRFVTYFARACGSCADEEFAQEAKVVGRIWTARVFQPGQTLAPSPSSASNGAQHRSPDPITRSASDMLAGYGSDVDTQSLQSLDTRSFISADDRPMMSLAVTPGAASGMGLYPRPVRPSSLSRRPTPHSEASVEDMTRIDSGAVGSTDHTFELMKDHDTHHVESYTVRTSRQASGRSAEAGDTASRTAMSRGDDRASDSDGGSASTPSSIPLTAAAVAMLGSSGIGALSAVPGAPCTRRVVIPPGRRLGLKSCRVGPVPTMGFGRRADLMLVIERVAMGHHRDRSDSPSLPSDPASTAPTLLAGPVHTELSRTHPTALYPKSDTLEFEFESPVELRGTIKFMILHDGWITDTELCRIWLHTDFVDPTEPVRFRKPDIDEACKDKDQAMFADTFHVQLKLEPIDT